MTKRLRTTLYILTLFAICPAALAWTVGEAKRDVADGEAVSLRGLAVTAVFPGSVYVEQPDRTAGIRVDTDVPLEEGDIVDVEGVIETDDYTHERYVDSYANWPQPTGGKLHLKPVGLLARAMVGGSLGFQEGLPDNPNLNNIGLLVTVWGSVTALDGRANSGYFMIKDGRAPAIKVIAPGGAAINPDWGYVTATGICSVERVNGVMKPVLKLRRASDVVNYQSWAAGKVSAMTTDEKIGQLFQVRLSGGYSMNSTDYQAIQSYRVGGFVYFASNISTATQAAGLTNALQSTAMASNGIPLLISMDQEGGIVTRIAGACDFPGNMALGSAHSYDVAFAAGSVLGSEVRAVGANMDLAPVLDTNTNPANPVIGLRSIGEQPQLVSSVGRGYIDGLHSAGCIATGKHFPGHGDTATDSHTGLPVVTYDFNTLDTIHGKPFRDCIANGLDCIMTAHILVTCLDSTLPATLSPAVLTGYLRNNIGFDGVCMTDSMGMGALANLGYTNEQECVMAIQAGNDIVLSPNSLSGAFAAVQSAVASGAITQARLDQSVMRILKLKRRYGLFEDPYVDADAAADIVGSVDHRATELAVARAGITLVRNANGVLPLHLNPDDKVLLVTVASTSDAASRFASYITAKHANTTSMSISTSPGSSTRASVVNAAASAAVVIIATYEAQNYSNQTTLVNQLIATGKPIICVGQGKPYELAGFANVPVYLCAYSYRNCSFAAAADVIFGDYDPDGLLPVSIPGTSYAFGWGLTY